MNILILSHFFTPYSGVGAKRMEALFVYLKKKNQNVYVISANTKEYGANVINDRMPIEKNEHIQLCNYYNNPILKKIMRVKQYWKVVPNVIVEKKIDMVIVSAGPFNYLKIVSMIKKKFPNIKCIIDFRDILDGSQCKNGKTNLGEKLGYNLDIIVEKNAVEYADLCITVSEQMCKYYKKRYPKNKDKFIFIQNGYDDITVSKDVQEQIEKFEFIDNKCVKTIRIGIFGKYGFYDDKYFNMLAQTVRKLKKEGVSINIVQFGVFENKMRDIFLKFGIEECYIYVASKGYEEDICKLQNCDATIATNYLKEALGTKIFDYIWINRPIITINPFIDGEQAQLTKKFQNGYVCNTEVELEKVIHDIVNLNCKKLDPDRKMIKQFSRSYQFNILYKELKRLEN